MLEDGSAMGSNQTNRGRDNSPDALYGSILAMEAVLGFLISERVRKAGTDPDICLRELRRQIESMQNGQTTTKYGTGTTLIADGIEDSLNAIFRKSEQALQS